MCSQTSKSYSAERKTMCVIGHKWGTGSNNHHFSSCSASGVYVPPMMIFKRKKNKPELVDHAPAGTIGQCSENGWIDSDLFLEFLKHFVTYTKCSKDSLVLLILDGHKTHTKNLTTIDYACDNGVVILSLPPHTSHKLQPLDRSFFKLLKSAFNAACSTWLQNHPGRRITVDKLGELFNTAYLKAATIENAVSGFKCTGIVPFNTEILPSSEFLDDPRETDATPPSPNHSIQSPVETAPSTAPSTESIQSPVHTVASLAPSTELIQSPVETAASTTPSTELIQSPVETAGSTVSQSCSLPPVPEEGELSSRNVSFSEIMKLPALTEKKKSRNSEESEIVTSSPYKQSLINERSKKRKPKQPAKGRKSKKTNTEKKSKKSKDKVERKVEDTQCPMCDGFWSEFKGGELWVQCAECKQ